MAPFFVSYFRCCLCRPSELGCKSELGLLGCRAVPTRCKYVHVSSRFSSMKTDGRHNPAPQAAYTLRAADGFFSQQLRSFCRCVGTPPIRPFDVTDDINEPTWTCLRRVVAGAYQRRGLHGRTPKHKGTSPVRVLNTGLHCYPGTPPNYACPRYSTLCMSRCLR